MSTFVMAVAVAVATAVVAVGVFAAAVVADFLPPLSAVDTVAFLELASLVDFFGGILISKGVKCVCRCVLGSFSTSGGSSFEKVPRVNGKFTSKLKKKCI